MPITKSCPVCGSSFKTYPSIEARGKGKYCSRSCGVKATNFKHGHGGNDTATRSKAYRIWNGILQRCKNPNSRAYKKYGAAGITVCERWEVFANFLADMGEPNEDQSIDRIDATKGYYKENCRWATRIEQQSHLSTSWKIEYQGDTICLSELSRRCGVPIETLRSRLLRGAQVDDAIKKVPS